MLDSDRRALWRNVRLVTASLQLALAHHNEGEARLHLAALHNLIDSLRRRHVRYRYTDRGLAGEPDLDRGVADLLGDV